MDELVFEGVAVRRLDEELRADGSSDNCILIVRPHGKACSVQLKCGDQLVADVLLHDGSEVFRSGGGRSVLLGSDNHSDHSSVLLTLRNEEEATRIWTVLVSICRANHDKEEQKKCAFNLRTEEASAAHYFQWYGHLCQQQNMLQDYIRTATFQSAFLQNCEMFKNKVVLDVGTGSGILSFFAIQAGASRVYAVDASSITEHCQQLVTSNGLADQIVVIHGKIEEVMLPEKVDILVSEPFGYMLYNERMLETYLHAKKWLKPGGHMMPTQGDLYVAPFSDEMLFMEQMSKSQFWQQKAFYSLDLSALKNASVQEYFSQPVVDTFDVRILMARPFKFSTNFMTAHESDMYKIVIPLDFELQTSGILHGAAVWLSTAPHQPLTHWYQVRCLLQTPLLVYVGERLTGTVLLNANERQSYDVNMQISVGDGLNKRNSSNVLDLKNPYFRYTGIAAPPPPGTHHESQTEQLWNAQTFQNNKMSVSSMAHLQNSTNQNPSAPCNLCNMNPNLLQQMVGGAVSQMGVAEPPK